MTAVLAFVDTETTHLSAEAGEVWEAAVIRREAGTETEHVWQFAPRNLDADVHGEALSVGRFHERYVVPRGYDAAGVTDGGHTVRPLTREQAVEELAGVLRGAVLIGSNAAFDDRHLRKLLNLGAAEQSWHYRPVCAVTHAAGVLAGIGQAMPAPWRSHDVSLALGVEPPAPDVAHTAMGDVAWAMTLWDAANRLAPSLRGCLVPGCLAQFDVMAAMTGLEPVSPSWSGKGWQIIRGSAVHAAGGHVCPAHADQFAAHFPTRIEPQVPGRVEGRCSCGKWSTDGLDLTWHGAARGLWEQHLLEEIGALTR